MICDDRERLMPILHIDHRLASLAEAATRSSVQRSIARRPHRRTVSVCTTEAISLSAEEALELVGTAIEVLAGVDTARLHTTFSADAHTRTPALETGSLEELEEMERLIDDVPAAFTEIEVSVESLIVSDLSVAAEWRIHARHTGAVEVDWAVIEATGQPIVIEGSLIGHLTSAVGEGAPRYVFDDLHLFYDTTNLLVQLTLI
jgi:hypothetical protein